MFAADRNRENAYFSPWGIGGGALIKHDLRKSLSTLQGKYQAKDHQANDEKHKVKDDATM